MTRRIRGIWGRPRQRLFSFRARRERTDRGFRAAIVAITLLGLAGLWSALPSGRSALLGALERVKWGALRRAGLEPPRAEVDAYWRDRRDRREARTRATYRGLFQALTPERQAFLRIAGMSPDDAVIRWGNYDMSLLLSSKVFARDDSGRYYRLLPGVRSVWLRQINVLGLDICQFLVPETPEVLRAAEAAGAVVVPGSAQTTNSWGCRGPEPDLSAPVRGLVLGDSFMQGTFVGDDQTPPARLQVELRARLGKPVAILDTGHLGYCPEHYYNTLRDFADRFRPRFVVVAVYINDFGEEPEVLRGEGDWIEEKYWLEKILQHCRARNVLCLIAPVPCQGQLTGTRSAGHYPGQVANITRVAGALFRDPTDDFINENLKLQRTDADAASQSPLYNGRLGDGHLSPAGCALWGRVVAERLALLLEARP